MSIDFSGKVVVITGSSSGIGQTAAIRFAEAGAFVTIHGRSAESLEATKKLLLEAKIPSDHFCVVQGELTDRKVLEELIDKSIEKFGRLDVLINNAGAAYKSGLKDGEERSMENFDFVLDLNLKVPITLAELAIPHLIKTKGTIINVSSISSQRSCPEQFYGIAKAGLDHFTRNYAALLASHGIRVNSLNPGMTQTTFFHRTEASLKALNIVKTIPIPLGRWGSTDDMANFLLFMASDKASYMTGSIINVDGGVMINAPSVKFD